MTKFSEPNFPALLTEQFDTLRTFDKDLLTSLSNWAMVLKSILDGGISIDDNVDASRVTVVGKGSSDPAFPNDTAANRAKNRRIEVSLKGLLLGE